MPRTREPTRTEHIAEALHHAVEADEELRAINLRRVPNGPLKDAIRQARHTARQTAAVAHQALLLDAETLRRRKP